VFGHPYSFALAVNKVKKKQNKSKQKWQNQVINQLCTEERDSYYFTKIISSTAT
jgi:hypothetical protein